MKYFLNKNNLVGISKLVFSPVSFFVFIMGFSFQISAQTSSSDIESNIQNLSEMMNFKTTKSGHWLLNEGVIILPYAHKALLSADTKLVLKVQLMTVLGEIADKRSIEPIIKAVQQHPELIKSAFLALAKIPETEESFLFASQQLTNKESSISVKGRAIWFFSQHKDRRALKWMKKIISENNNKLEDAALYLSAILEDESVKVRIIEKLNQTKKNPLSVQYTLLSAFAVIAKPQEFISGTIDIKQSRYYQSAKRLNAYKFGDKQQRTEIAKEMLRSRYPLEKRKGIQYLISQDLISDFPNYKNSIYARNQIRLSRSVFIDKDGDAIPK